MCTSLAILSDICGQGSRIPCNVRGQNRTAAANLLLYLTSLNNKTMNTNLMIANIKYIYYTTLILLDYKTDQTTEWKKFNLLFGVHIYGSSVVLILYRKFKVSLDFGGLSLKLTWACLGIKRCKIEV